MARRLLSPPSDVMGQKCERGDSSNSASTSLDTYGVGRAVKFARSVTPGAPASELLIEAPWWEFANEEGKTATFPLISLSHRAFIVGREPRWERLTARSP